MNSNTVSIFLIKILLFSVEKAIAFIIYFCNTIYNININIFIEYY